jgi:putative flippase GtrA
MEYWRISKFVVVGILNTTLDLAIFNYLTSKRISWTRIPANIASTSIAMAFSFAMNFFLVFTPSRDAGTSHAYRFVVITALGLYVIQNTVIWLMTNVVPQPIAFTVRSVRRIEFFRCNTMLLERNLVKLSATIASLTWNYLWYKYYVFS